MVILEINTVKEVLQTDLSSFLFRVAANPNVHESSFSAFDMINKKRYRLHVLFMSANLKRD